MSEGASEVPFEENPTPENSFEFEPSEEPEEEHLDFDEESGVLSIPNRTGVAYFLNGNQVTGFVEVRNSVTIVAKALEGFRLEEGSQSEFTFTKA